MRKWAKPKIIIPIVIVLISLGLWAGFKNLGWLNYRFGAYLVRDKFMYYWCDPKELIVHMEGIFGHKFPDGITEIKAAKTLRSEGSVSFIIRFTAEPNVVDAFVNSFPGEVKIEEYAPSDDVRIKLWSAPAWFKKPIRKGKIGFPSMNRPARGRSIIYIDMTNEKWYVVYMSGHYR